MRVGKDRIVEFEFELKDDQGRTLDTSADSGPLRYLHGVGELVAGLENHLEGKQVGDTFEVTVEPKEGYGERDESLIFEVPKSAFGPELKPRKGMRLTMEDPSGAALPVVVRRVKISTVIVDATHELAGMRLNYSGKVLAVDCSKQSELAPAKRCGCC